MLHKFIYGGHVADYMNEMQARPRDRAAIGHELRMCFCHRSLQARVCQMPAIRGEGDAGVFWAPTTLRPSRHRT